MQADLFHSDTSPNSVLHEITVILSSTYIAPDTGYLQGPGEKTHPSVLQKWSRVSDLLFVLLFKFTMFLFKVRHP